MKTLLTLALLLPSLSFASDLTVYKCDYRIAKPDGKIYEMSGNIVADDATATATEPYRYTHLTLAPNELSGDTTEARILITSDGYNPITLIKPGQSASPLADSLLGRDGGELGYAGANGSFYRVICRRR